MDEPSYDVIANPISAFTTFGEAAPNPEATVEGMPAPPVDEYGPLLAQFTQLSNTLTGLYYDQQQKKDKAADVRGVARIEENASELLQSRKENALSIASLIDKGILTDSENPWFYVGAKRALARLNAQAVEDQLNSNFEVDFANNVAELNSDPEPAVAMAKYLGTKTNPLNLSQDILDDYYYSSNYENSFSKLRRRATTRLIEMRNMKAKNDQQNAIRADVVDALRNPSQALDLPEGAVDINGEPIQALDHKQSVAAVISDYQNRAVFGNQKLVELVGSYLIELAKDGDVLALDALQNARLSGGQTLLDNDAVKAEYALEEDSIARGIERYRTQDRKNNNKMRVEFGKTSISNALVGDPFLTPAGIASRVEGVEFDVRDGTLSIPREGETPVIINFEKMRDQALDMRFERNVVNAPGSPEQRVVAAMVVSQLDGHIHDGTKASLDRVIDLSRSGQTLTEEGVAAFRSALDIYRLVENSGNEAVMNSYFTNETRAMMYLIDLLEKGNVGPLGAATGGTGMSGNLEGAIATVQRIDTAKAVYGPKIKEFKDEFFAKAQDQGINPELLVAIQATGEAAVALGIPVDAQDVISDHITTTDHSAFSSMYGVQISREEAEVLFDDLVNYAQESPSLLREGTIVRTLQEEAITYGGAMGTADYRNWLSGVKFVHSPDASGGFLLQHSGQILGYDRFSQQQLREDLNYREGLPELSKVTNVNAYENLSETLKDSEKTPTMGGL